MVRFFSYQGFAIRFSVVAAGSAVELQRGHNADKGVVIRPPHLRLVRPNRASTADGDSGRSHLPPPRRSPSAVQLRP